MYHSTFRSCASKSNSAYWNKQRGSSFPALWISSVTSSCPSSSFLWARSHLWKLSPWRFLCRRLYGKQGRRCGREEELEKKKGGAVASVLRQEGGRRPSSWKADSVLWSQVVWGSTPAISRSEDLEKVTSGVPVSGSSSVTQLAPAPASLGWLWWLTRTGLHRELIERVIKVPAKWNK